MSLVGDRLAIATALSTADSVQGYEYRPATPRTGDAWPLLGVLDRADGLSFYATWRVLVFLPQDERAASVWMDEHVEGLVDVLEPVGFIDRIEPVELTAGSGGQFALQITMRSE